ncbi:MAG: S1 RNA-binding domain-containing protein [Oscillospiraceae bacterium]|nr:S1 RNA-binding domain-containing protein [Oscillospiraceae bacterium]
MELTVGAVLEGKVKSITNFGAFVSLPENKTGMVHISEVANAYVSDIRQHLTEGQDVKVMVIGCENGKINLSIKRLEPKPQRENAPRPNNFRNNNAPRREGGFQKKDDEQAQNEGGYSQNRGYNQNRGGYNQNRPQRAPMQPAAPKTADQLFEEKLKAFMSESDNKLSGIRADHRTKSRRR